MIRAIALTLLFLGLIFGGICGFILLSIQHLPKNNPGNFTGDQNRKTVVFAGDSITHGNISADFVEMTAEQASAGSWNYVNAGVNADLSYNLLSRFEEIVRCDPDRIIILIGTNDVNGSSTPEAAERAIKNQDLPQEPSKEWFRQNLATFMSLMRDQTGAKIAVFTIPPIGESLEHPINEQVREFNRVIREVAAEFGADILPLYEEIAIAIAENAPPEFKPKDPAKFKSLVTGAALKRILLRKSFDRIGEKNGYLYHSDPLHLDEDGARFASNLAVELLSGKIREAPSTPGSF